MARLTRVRQKVFASNASNNGVFGSLQAGNPQTSNDVATLQSLSAFENGWDDAIEQGDKLPPLEEFQGIQYGISYQQAYMLQEGIAEWETNTPYYKGGLVKTISGTSFKLYCSLADNNTGNVVTNTTYWKKVMDSDDVYAFDSLVVHLSGAETINDVKTVTGHWNFKTEQTISNTGVTKGTNPSSAQYTTLSFCDKNGTAYTANQLGNVQHRLDTDGTSTTSLTAIKNDANSTSNASIGVSVKDDGTTYGYAPTPSSVNDNSTKIATTAWFKNVLSTLYPVGSLYIGTQTSCPLASLISGSTWEIVATDKALWGGDGTNGNTTINAGLPNITGSQTVVFNNNHDANSGCLDLTGASLETSYYGDGTSTATRYQTKALSFNAGNSNSIYGNSTTVQPPAYRVNVWRRTA